MVKLTDRQSEVLDLITGWIRRLGYPPTLQELADELEVSSKTTVHNHLLALEKKKVIRREYNRPRAISVLI